MCKDVSHIKMRFCSSNSNFLLFKIILHLLISIRCYESKHIYLNSLKHRKHHLSLFAMSLFGNALKSRSVGCRQNTSEELDTSHFSLKPINLSLPPQWSSCLASTSARTFFYLLHFHLIPLTTQPCLLVLVFPTTMFVCSKKLCSSSQCCAHLNLFAARPIVQK